MMGKAGSAANAAGTPGAGGCPGGCGAAPTRAHPICSAEVQRWLLFLPPCSQGWTQQLWSQQVLSLSWADHSACGKQSLVLRDKKVRIEWEALNLGRID